MNTYIVLRLDGLVQSYSNNGTESFKISSQFPTKSAITGLLGCAMGIDRKDRESLAELCNSFTMAVRCDRGPYKLTDFQIISGKTNPYGCHLTVESMIKGGKTKSVENKIINKEYLSDCAFTVLIKGSKEFLEKCVEALYNPKWMCVLGRYNCIPSIPIYPKKTESIYVNAESFEEAFKQVTLIERHNQNTDNLYTVEEEIENFVDVNNGSCRMQFDFVLSTTQVGTYSYGSRYVKQYVVRQED